jgi:hypothetical protein
MLTISILFTISSGFMAAFWSMPVGQRRGAAYIFPIAGGAGLIATLAYILALNMGWIAQ